MMDRPEQLTAFQVELAGIFFTLEAADGYLVAGGAALLASDLIARPTDDVALRDATLPTRLRRLLADKDAAHYSPNLIVVDKATGMVRQATALLAEADAQ
jgi:hypothetical protein